MAPPSRPLLGCHLPGLDAEEAEEEEMVRAADAICIAF